MVCLNLPAHLRYLPENVYLAGVIPGPTKPSTDQINHFLAIVVDEFLEFWDPGVFYTRTALKPQGRRARAALVPVVADLVGARQIVGFGPHNHNKVLCTICTLNADNVEETDPANFKARDRDEHRAAAKAWLDAETTLEREALLIKTGVRYSELLRLDYWNPFLYTVVDTMHNLYLGILQRHVRSLWGINVKMDDGDASELDSTSSPPLPDKEDMATGLRALLYGTKSELSKVGKGVLYHLCVERGLRRAGTVSQLVKNLVAWVSMYGDKLTPQIRASEKTLAGPKAATALPRKHKETLIAMCAIRGLSTEGVKDVLAQRLIDWRAHGAETGINQDSTGEPEECDEDDDNQPVRHGREAIGRDTLAAYRQDRARIEVPSWVNPPPVAFGTAQHGKLSADQWRSLCTINLPITLIRTWGMQEERRVRMLKNFLDLVEAVERFGVLETDERNISTAESLMHRYLEGVKELYHGAKIQPNHHLALHIGIFLRLFGPVHSWRAFAFERFNYFLQTLNSNMQFGELEMTMMVQSCRAANLRPLLRSPVVARHMQDLSNCLKATEKNKRRGMRFDAILRSVAPAPDLPQGEPYRGIRPAALDSAVYIALLSRLNADEAHAYVDERTSSKRHNQVFLSSIAKFCATLEISGVHYKPHRRSAGDSNVIFRHPATRQAHPGRIEQIFQQTRRRPGGQEVTETFLVVKQLQELDVADAAKDPYRKYPGVGGCLYYDAYQEKPVVLRVQDVVSHFARTAMDHLIIPRPSDHDIEDPGSGGSSASSTFSSRCVHVRPLDRVSVSSFMCSGRVPDDHIAVAGSTCNSRAKQRGNGKSLVYSNIIAHFVRSHAQNFELRVGNLTVLS
ncbi:hypothetical protein GY45DRAFT_1264415 [Cubamyces sp. BRFM 1775]|nr:hypothetical protein GY45DRAFT_1264415 [Cubamyces sp. BRFM 1775]